MISDVPYGSFLSGGLDSSIIVSEMTNNSKDKIKTYNIGFGEENFNEFGYAREVSDFFGSLHEEVLMEKEGYFSLINKMVQFKDSPMSVPNEVAIHQLSKFLKRYIQFYQGRW